MFFFSNFTYEIFDHSFPKTLFLCYETMIFFPSLSQVFIDAKHSKKKFAAIKLIKNSLQVLTRHNFIQCWFLRKKLQNYFFFLKKKLICIAFLKNNEWFLKIICLFCMILPNFYFTFFFFNFRSTKTPHFTLPFGMVFLESSVLFVKLELMRLTQTRLENTDLLIWNYHV